MRDMSDSPWYSLATYFDPKPYRRRELAMSSDKPAPLTYKERTRLFVLSGIPQRTPAEEAEYAALKARVDAEDGDNAS